MNTLNILCGTSSKNRYEFLNLSEAILLYLADWSKHVDANIEECKGYTTWHNNMELFVFFGWGDKRLTASDSVTGEK